MRRFKSHSLRRSVDVKAFVENGAETFNLDPQYDIESVLVVISGDITLTTAATAVRGLAPSQLITRMELYSDGSKTHEETNGALAAFANFERGMRRNVTQPAVGIATHPVRCSFRLDRSTYDGMRPRDSALHTSKRYMSLLQLRLSYGALADMFDIGPGVISGHTLQVQVFQIENQELERADSLEARMLRTCSLQEIVVDSSNSNLQMTLPVGNLMRGVKLITLDENMELSDDIVTNVKFKRGTDVRIDFPFVDLRGENADDYRIPEATRLEGVCYVDLIPDGRLNRLYPLNNASSAHLVMDVTKPAGGNGTIYAQIIEYIPQRSFS